MNPPTNHLRIRIYYEDTDCGNVVYYANYLKYMERGRTEVIRDLGFDLDDLHKQDILFVVVEASVKYRRSARYNDILDVETAITGHTPVTLTFHYEIANQRGVLCVTGEVKAACVDRTGKLRRIPGVVIDKLTQSPGGPG